MRSTPTAVYEIFDRLPMPQSYFGKLVVASLAGTQLPLVALAGYLLLASGGHAAETRPILLVTLAATLAGAAVTAGLLWGLLAPIARAAEELQTYLSTRRRPAADAAPALPAADLAGRLLRAVRYAVAQLDELAGAHETAVELDALTGVYNRRAGRRRLAEEIARRKREGGEFTVAVVDLDGFEALAERFGHAFADRCLRELGHALAGNLRQSDWVARRNGRQFLVGLAGAGEHKLLPVLGRVYRALEVAPVPTPDGPRLRLSVSIGLAQMGIADDSAELVRRADRALHRAKLRGRNTAAYDAPEDEGAPRLAA